jgi:hypothetical protein
LVSASNRPYTQGDGLAQRPCIGADASDVLFTDSLTCQIKDFFLSLWLDTLAVYKPGFGSQPVVCVSNGSPLSLSRFQFERFLEWG